MKTATSIANILARLSGLVQIILGLLIWTGNFDALIPVHILVGSVLVLSLWTLALLAAEAGVDRRFVVLAVLWGFLAPALGLTQGQLLVGDAHWVIQALHLLIGLGAIGQAIGLTVRIRRAQAPELQQPAEQGQGQVQGQGKAQGQEIVTTGRQPAKRQNRGWRVARAVLIGPAVLLALSVAGVFAGLQATALPPAINMSSTGDMGEMGGMSMPVSQPIPPGPATPIASLAAPLESSEAATHTSAFTLTAEPARLTLGPGEAVDAWTYNGTAPGPTLRVRQGDLVAVTLMNHLPVGVTIHWHGVAVPNSADGVAGLTQDAVKPGESFIYRFIAKDPGTYWYHSHQQSLDETTRGLYGMLVVDPAAPVEHDDVDVALALHGWTLGGQSPGPFSQRASTINETTGTLRIPAGPGQWVRLRIANTGGNEGLRVTLLGAPFTVVALDGHDLNAPTPLDAVPLPVGEAQRYDIRFRMPSSGSVALVTAAGDGQYRAEPAVVVGPVGEGNVPSPLPAANAQLFDLAGYGSPRPEAITLQSHFDVSYTMTLNRYVGFWAGRLGQVWTLNGQAFPYTQAYVVQPGQLVKVHIVNAGSDIHTMHLHGHSFAVLTRNGRPLTGSPVRLDTLLVGPKETYDIAFHADNPGLWMFHCHNLVHANWGMDMMLVYPHISTPYSVGPRSGNFPD